MNKKLDSLKFELLLALGAEHSILIGAFNEDAEKEVREAVLLHLDKVIEKMITEIAEIYKNKN